MKPQQLASLLNIAPVTLRHWCAREYREFLSPTAQGIEGSKRSFTELDARILSWIVTMKEQNVSTPSILITLRNAKADNWRELPLLPDSAAITEPIEMMPREAVEERIRSLQEKFETRLVTLQDRITTLESEKAKVEADKAELQRRLDKLTDEFVKISLNLSSLHIRKKKKKK